MASVCLTEEADCLRDLGQLDAAAAKYLDAINRAERLEDDRQVATNKFQLGFVRLQQKRFGDAIRIYQEARDTFESLGEPQQVATIWHQIGMVHEEAGNLEDAESAYQKSLAMSVQAGNKASEATTRNQLGSLYNRMDGRQEEAVQFFRQAAEIHADPEIFDRLHEGMARSNAASVLIRLGRLDEARRELIRALECKRGLGPNAEMWKTWDILHDLETAAGNAAAAAEARGQAMAEYEKARRQGWQITAGPAVQLCQTVATIVLAKHPATPPEQIPSELKEQLPQIEAGLRRQLEQAIGNPRMPDYFQALAPNLLAILAGSRDPALADDAVELKLLLEKLP